MRLSAQEVLDKYWDGSIPVKTIAIANKMGVLVYRQEGMDVSGLVEIRDGKHVIVFNASEPAVRQRFTIAHEIGHIALAHSTNSQGVLFRDDVSKFMSGVVDYREVEANKFAAELLMPSSSVRLACNLENITITKLADLFQVSGAAMEYRLINLGVIND